MTGYSILSGTISLQRLSAIQELLSSQPLELSQILSMMSTSAELSLPVNLIQRVNCICMGSLRLQTVLTVPPKFGELCSKGMGVLRWKESAPNKIQLAIVQST